MPKQSGKHGEHQATFDGDTGVGKHRRDGGKRPMERLERGPWIKRIINALSVLPWPWP